MQNLLPSQLATNILSSANFSAERRKDISSVLSSIPRNFSLVPGPSVLRGPSASQRCPAASAGPHGSPPASSLLGGSRPGSALPIPPLHSGSTIREHPLMLRIFWVRIVARTGVLSRRKETLPHHTKERAVLRVDRYYSVRLPNVHFSQETAPAVCRMASTAPSTVTYDIEHRSESILSFTLFPSGEDRSTIRRHFPDFPLGITPNLLTCSPGKDPTGKGPKILPSAHSPAR